MLFCCGALWAVTAATPLCSQIRIVPRAKLDSLAHPATADGAEAMRFERTQIDAGHIGEDDTPPGYTFKWHNEGTAPLIITRVQTTCGCAAATYGRQPVRTGVRPRVRPRMRVRSSIVRLARLPMPASAATHRAVRAPDW